MRATIFTLKWEWIELRQKNQEIEANFSILPQFLWILNSRVQQTVAASIIIRKAGNWSDWFDKTPSSVNVWVLANCINVTRRWKEDTRSVHCSLFLWTRGRINKRWTRVSFILEGMGGGSAGILFLIFCQFLWAHTQTTNKILFLLCRVTVAFVWITEWGTQWYGNWETSRKEVNQGLRGPPETLLPPPPTSTIRCSREDARYIKV